MRLQKNAKPAWTTLHWRMASALTIIVPDSTLKSQTNAKLAKTTLSYPQAQIIHANSTMSIVNKWYHKNAQNVLKPISLTTKDHAQLYHMDAKSPTHKPSFAQFAWKTSLCYLTEPVVLMLKFRIASFSKPTKTPSTSVPPASMDITPHSINVRKSLPDAMAMIRTQVHALLVKITLFWVKENVLMSIVWNNR